MRKHPQQHRSREMVQALIDATGRVIQRDGLDNATTGRIAEQAGVSVGSLYQYFADKDALVQALVDYLADDIGSGLRAQPLMEHRNLRDMVGGAIRFGFSMLRSRDGLYLELMRNWYRLPTGRMVDVLQRHFMELTRLYFLRHHRAYPVEKLEVRVFVVTNSVLFTMIRHISEEPPLVRDRDLADELTHMVADYLGAPPRDGTSP